MTAACIVAAVVAALPVQAAQVAAGNAHSLQVRADSTLWAWGANTNGQLGDGTKVAKSATVQVLSGVSESAAGFAHTLAVKTDGTLWAWGWNLYGQLGDGTTGDKSNPTRMLNDVRSVAAGGSRSHAIRTDNTLWSWGLNDAGQLGDGTKMTRTTPVQVLAGVHAVAAGAAHTLALKQDGTLWAWGSNSSGQLGDGTTVERIAPVQVLAGVRAVAAGAAFTIALKNDGSVWTWGNNALGQLGDGATTARAFPAQVTSGASAVAAGSYHALALKGQTLWAWGGNQYGQVGDGTTTNRPSPTQIRTDIAAIAGGNAHTIAMKADGTLLTWGNNADGQLGDGSTVSRATPFLVLHNGQGVAAGVHHSVSLKSDGSVWAWGDNFFGQLGIGGTTAQGTPARIIADARAVATGQYHTVALRSENSVWTWGFNLYGQLGDATTQDRSTPAQVLSGVQSIAAGAHHTLAIKLDGSLWAWGNNLNGQLGDGTTTSRASPVQVLAGVTAVAAGSQHTVAVKNDGSVWTWGFNSFGQLGDGTTVNRPLPVRVFENGAAVAAGGFHTLVIRTDGTLWAWGLNARGQIGDGTTDNRAAPVQVLAKVASIVAGQDFNLAKKIDGTMWSWGANRSGTLGPGFNGPLSTVPFENAYLRNAAAVAAGAEHALAIDAAGQVLTWGDNGNQQLGIVRTQQSSTPTPPADPVAPFAGTVLVVEFFNPTIMNGAGTAGVGHYFITASAAEAAGIDVGLAGPGWRRTGRTFRAWLDQGSAPAGAVPVCRFYAQAPNSHFYTADPAECQSLRALNPANDVAAGWAYENIAFYTVLPAAGQCPAGYDPIYRSYNNRFSPVAAANDGNHRITPSKNDHQRAVTFFGHADEGIGFCSPVNVTGAGADLQATFTYPGATTQSGSLLRVEFSFGNNGAGAAGGASVFAALPPEVIDWSLACTPRGGADCPAMRQADRLRSGLVVANWPAGGGLTLTATGTAPSIAAGSEPTLTFAASVAGASGSPDPNLANNTPPVARTIVKRAAICNLAINPEALSVGPGNQSVHVALVTGDGCAWSATSSASWLQVTPASGSGESVLSVVPAANTVAAPRTATLAVGGKSLIVSQAGTVPANSCASLRLQRDGEQVAAEGLTGVNTFTLYAENECEWAAQSTAPWIAVVAGGSGKGNGGIHYTVFVNDQREVRSGTIVVGEKAFTINQAAFADGDSSGGSDGGGDGGDGGGSSGGSSGGDSG